MESLIEHIAEGPDDSVHNHIKEAHITENGIHRAAPEIKADSHVSDVTENPTKSVPMDQLPIVDENKDKTQPCTPQENNEHSSENDEQSSENTPDASFEDIYIKEEESDIDVDEESEEEPIDFFACEEENGEEVLRALVKEEAEAHAVDYSFMSHGSEVDAVIKQEASENESISSAEDTTPLLLPYSPFNNKKDGSKDDKVTAPTAMYMGQLLPFYMRGLDNYSSEPARALLREAMTQTGLSEAQIKRWIDNYKRKTRHAEQPGAARVRIPRRRIRGIDLFYRENLAKHEGLTNNDRMKLVAAAWKMASEEEKARYHEAAKLLPPPDESAVISDPKLKKRKIKDILSNMEKEVKSLEQLGYRGVLLLTVNEDGVFNASGSTRQVNWINDQQPIQKVLIATCYVDGLPVRNDQQTKDRIRVQEIFNTKYCEAGGTGKKCSYKSIDKGLLTAIGLPEGISLKRPSAYGSVDLARIVENEEKITFVLSQSTISSGDSSPEGETSTTVNIKLETSCDPNNQSTEQENKFPQEHSSVSQDISQKPSEAEAVPAPSEQSPSRKRRSKPQPPGATPEKIARNRSLNTGAKREKKKREKPLTGNKTSKKHTKDSSLTTNIKSEKLDGNSSPDTGSKLETLFRDSPQANKGEQEGMVNGESSSFNKSSESTDVKASESADKPSVTTDTKASGSTTEENLPDGFFEVEKILEEKKRRGKWLYLVKWKGYDEPSWEPRKNVTEFAIKCFRQSR